MILGLILATAASVWAVNLWHHKWSGEYAVTTSLSTGALLKTDTLYIEGENAARFKSIMYAVMVKSAYSTARGFGLLDSARCVLKTKFTDTLSGAPVYLTIDSQQATAIPAFFRKCIVSNDTLIKAGGLVLMVTVADSVSDTVMSTTYPISWDVTLKD